MKQVYRLSEVQRLLRPQPALIITSDDEMRALGDDPLMQVRAFDGKFGDLVESCKASDGALINVAYDFFFGGNVRELFPTSPECVRAFKALHDVARAGGVGFGASVLSPLDLGPAYYREKGRGAGSHQFQEGELKPDGSYAVPIRVQQRWFHNKGPNFLHLKGVRAFAYNEERLGDTHYYYVDPVAILEIDGAELTVDESTSAVSGAGFGYAEGVVRGRANNAGGRNRILVVVQYETEEIDYFHEDALPWLKGMLDAHKAAGISYDSFYSDEMHIQFDWDLGTHFGATEIATRHITPALEAAYSARFGACYADLDRWLIYFSYAQHGFLQAVGAEPEPCQHVWGRGAEDVYAVWKFRRDYYRLLADHVVDLFVEAKRYGEEIFSRPRIWTRAHATWQEAPTCDHTNAAWAPASAPRSRYDYTPAYDWSSSIREDISACYDYFRWGDFLTGMGTDHPEGGYIDRNYYGAALACAWGSYNDVPYGYFGHWGAPKEVSQRVFDASAAWGIDNSVLYTGWVQGFQHRKMNVLALYPLDLNYVEERFGSWMVQYGYCDWITAEKLAEWGHVEADGRITLRGRAYDTLAVLYNPMILRSAFDLVRRMAERGGRVLWTGPAPAIYIEDGAPALQDWQAVFGIRSVQAPWQGLNAENTHIVFNGSLAAVPPFRVPTHLLPDAVYPVVPAEGSEAVAAISLGGKVQTLGVRKGRVVYLGARPRDDQAHTTPDAPRTFYNLLEALGAYSPTGAGWAEWASNSGELLVCESPNNAVTVTHHYYPIAEDWSGGFFREETKPYESLLLPPVRLELRARQVGPYIIGYSGDRVVSFKVVACNLTAFAGANTTGIIVDGREFKLTDAPADITFAPLPDSQLASGVAKGWFVYVKPLEPTDVFALHLPFGMPDGALWAADPHGNGRGEASPAVYSASAGETVLHIPRDLQGVPLLLFQER
ncbi:MAG: hypothetical protein LLG44_14410 [Chloroflexi bacterium]|nr:hypothetical protein [Chloroflexota bacterium]